MFPVPVASKPLAPADPVAVQLGVPKAASKLSATVASVTFDGPLLCATIVYVSPTPGVYVSDPSVFVMLRSATDACVSVSVAVLFVRFASLTADDTVAVFTRSPVLAALTALTVTTYVTDPPLGIVIPVSLRFPVPVASKTLAPADPVAVQLGVPKAASKLSATVASVTFDGPLLCATIVYVSPTPGVYVSDPSVRSEEQTSTHPSRSEPVCRLLLRNKTLTADDTVAVF